MIKFLVNHLVKNKEDLKNPKVIKSYGYLCGAVGIITNTLLTVVKILIGISVNSIAVVADAVNNFSDIGSSVVTIIGFGISDKPADEKHPFGHARAEYLSALVIAVMVVVVGFQFLRTSIDKIKSPEDIKFSMLTFVILCLSITIKLWQAKLYSSIGTKIKSQPLQAAAVDSKSDVITTSVVAISLLSSLVIPFPIDGYIGFAVSIFIIYNGYKIVVDAVDPLIGIAPDQELVDDILENMNAVEGIMGWHDLIVHSYGGRNIIATIHAEVSHTMDIVDAHEIIDSAEKEISKKLGIKLIMHMDPIDFEDENTKILFDGTKKIIHEIDKKLNIHDFRIVPKKNGAVIFDLVIPVDYNEDNVVSLVEEIKKQIEVIYGRKNVVINIEKA